MLLAIESSATPAGLALLAEPSSADATRPEANGPEATGPQATDVRTETLTVRWSAHLTAEQQTARDLSGLLDGGLKQCNIGPSDLRGIVVNSGPGSFTGLRIGIVMAKSLAYALQIPVWQVSTFALLSRSQLPVSSDRCLLVIDAFRKQVFAQPFHCQQQPSALQQTTPQEWQAAGEPQVMPVDQVATQYPHHAIAGPAVDKYRPIWSQASTEQPAQAPLELVPTTPDLAAMAAREIYQPADLWKLTPNYLRASAAEENVKRSRECDDSAGTR